MMTTATSRVSCSRCGNDDIPETDLAAVNNDFLGPGWYGVCEPCAEADGVLFEFTYRLSELRAGTLFCWWQHRGFFSEADKDDE